MVERTTATFLNPPCKFNYPLQLQVVKEVKKDFELTQSKSYPIKDDPSQHKSYPIKEELTRHKSYPISKQAETSPDSPDDQSFSLPKSVVMVLRRQESKYEKEMLEEEKDSLTKLSFKKTDPIQINVIPSGGLFTSYFLIILCKKKLLNKIYAFTYF